MHSITTALLACALAVLAGASAADKVTADELAPALLAAATDSQDATPAQPEPAPVLVAVASQDAPSDQGGHTPAERVLLASAADSGDSGPSDSESAAAGAEEAAADPDDGATVDPRGPPSPEDVGIGAEAGKALTLAQAGEWVAMIVPILLIAGAMLRALAMLVAKDFATSKLGGKVIAGGAALLIGLAYYAAKLGWGGTAVLMALASAALASGIWSQLPTKLKSPLQAS